MKKRKILALIMALLCVGFFIFAGCTENSRAKNFGGEASLELPVDQKLVVVTWKDDALWYLTRPMRSDEIAETYTFSEKSSWGVWEGTYHIKESKTKK